jgi:hypothetical protein
MDAKWKVSAARAIHRIISIAARRASSNGTSKALICAALTRLIG